MSNVNRLSFERDIFSDEDTQKLFDIITPLYKTVKQTCERCEGSGEITQHTNQIFDECDNLINNFNLAIDNMFGRTKL